MEKETARQIINILSENYPEAGCGLNFSDPYELLVATILSAQCTDTRVNKTTPELFAAADTPEKMIELGEEKLAAIIRPCGLSAGKSKNIIETSRILISDYAGSVPSGFEALTSLPGVGRKTANVVLSNAFGADAIAVDTHVFRVSNRTGLADSSNVLKTEKMLMQIIPKSLWSLSHHLLILHGRRVCTARNPKCGSCEINKYCEKKL